MVSTVLLNNIAINAHQTFFWVTPYKSGNLARSVGDVGSIGGGVGFYMFDRNQSAPYGALLNEKPVIDWKITNKYTGKVYEGSYVNKHYMWVDNGIESTVIPNICTAFNLQRG